MEYLQLFSQKDLKSLLKTRKGETKFGEQIKLLPNLTNIYEDLKDLDVRYVIFGIEEDIGVRANLGNPGTYKCWKAVKKILINIQSNTYTHAKKVLILGSLNYKSADDDINQSVSNIKNLRSNVEKIDADVTYLVSQIIKAGKIPIAVGGGHNNSYGMIKGSAFGLNQPIAVINIDAHSDFRPEEGRHSGNGFSYALAEGFLKKYFIMGLHENFTSRSILSTMKKMKAVDFVSYEAMEVRSEIGMKTAIESCIKHVDGLKVGLEIDCDAIINVPSSAATPAGFTVKQVRRMLHSFGQTRDLTYLHICEAIPSKKSKDKIGKLISYLITDFIRAHES
ncbi:formimidoylglutamase [Winogradskyella aurantiaca]|uniref:formimidoylglutamase n=1 Tax=Winogradskyella aurantiaca TaxID=2219558 RepID=UPI000E1CD9BA|nr:formimidoylglutamase [Winogradskyella aurantiaca]